MKSRVYVEEKLMMTSHVSPRSRLYLQNIPLAFTFHYRRFSERCVLLKDIFAGRVSIAIIAETEHRRLLVLVVHQSAPMLHEICVLANT